MTLAFITRKSRQVIFVVKFKPTIVQSIYSIVILSHQSIQELKLKLERDEVWTSDSYPKTMKGYVENLKNYCCETEEISCD